MSVAQNKEIIRQFVNEVLNKNDVELAEQLLAADFTEHEQLPPGVESGRGSAKMLSAMPE